MNRLSKVFKYVRQELWIDAFARVFHSNLRQPIQLSQFSGDSAAIWGEFDCIISQNYEKHTLFVMEPLCFRDEKGKLPPTLPSRTRGVLLVTPNLHRHDQVGHL